MFRRLTLVALLVVAVLALFGCSARSSEVPSGGPVSDEGPHRAGLRPAPGLYDQSDGSVQAIGVLEYRDLEGGFWAVIDTTEAGGAGGSVVAVITNSDDFSERIESLEGATVVATGTRLEGASIRMAGPEIEATEIEAVEESVDPAE